MSLTKLNIEMVWDVKKVHGLEGSTSEFGIIFSKVYLLFCYCPKANLRLYHGHASIIHGMDMGYDCILGNTAHTGADVER